MRNLLRASDVCDHLETFPGLWHTLQAKHLDRGGRPNFSYRFAAIVEHCAHLAKDLSHDKVLLREQRRKQGESCWPSSSECPTSGELFPAGFPDFGVFSRTHRPSRS